MRKAESANELTRQLEAYAAVSRAPERINRSRWGKWPIYAAATGAALAGASAATADIVYSGPIDVKGTSFNIYGPGGNPLFGFRVGTVLRGHINGNSTSSHRGGESVNIRNEYAFFDGAFPFGERAVAFGNGGPPIYLPNAFAPGSPIQAPPPLSRIPFSEIIGKVSNILTHKGRFPKYCFNPPPNSICFTTGQGNARGSFQKPGFLGLEILKTSNGQVKPGSEELGWVQLQFDTTTFPGAVEVLDWAYNTDGPINAGQTSELPEPSPSPVLLLAAGAAGVTAWKRRRRRKSAANAAQ